MPQEPEQQSSLSRWETGKWAYEREVEEHGLIRGTIRYYKRIFGMEVE